MTWVSCLGYGHVHIGPTEATSAIVAAPAANSWLPEPLSAFLVLLPAFATVHPSDNAKSEVIASASLEPNWNDSVAEPRLSLSDCAPSI